MMKKLKSKKINKKIRINKAKKKNFLIKMKQKLLDKLKNSLRMKKKIRAIRIKS
jgi:hypothetical protein